MADPAMRRVLCVDDEPRALDGLELNLRKQFDVSIATSGDAAVDAMRSRGPFAVVVADLKMPHMDGIALLSKVKATSPNTVRILLTGQASVETAVAAVNDIAIFRLLLKPCSPEVLANVLMLACEQYSRNVRAQAAAKETQLEQAFLLATDPILVLDSTGAVIFHNPAATGFFNVGPETLQNFCLGVPLVPEGEEQLINSTSGRVAQMRATKIEWETKPCWLVILRDVSDRVQMIQELEEAKVKLELANQRLYETSISDPLTGLFNRRGFEEQLWTELARARRYGGNPCAILIDCDEFKAINTRYGHQGGDEALKHVAEVIKTTCRATDVVSRVGGDEFLVILPDTREAEGVLVAEKIRKRVFGSPATSASGPIAVSISAGVAALAQGSSTIESILLLLQQALHASKDAGRNRVVSSDAECIATPRIEQMMTDGFFEVFSQPIVDLADGHVFGFECFCRGAKEPFKDPECAFRVAREAGRLTELDLRCLDIATKRIAGKRPQHYHFSLFPSTLIEEGGVGVAGRILSEANATFCIEFSEQSFTGNTNAIRDTFLPLRQKGVYLALSDIGFGGRTLEAIISLEPDFIRVSREFLGSFDEAHARRRSWSKLMTIARAIGAKIIAEGVEKQNDAKLLEDLGVHYGQGFFYGEPLLVD
jgi:diguanylate cyclase (GGDEF)-like protein